MKTYNDINAIDKKTKPTALKKGESATYRLMGVEINSKDPSKSKIPCSQNVKNRDRIWDANKNEFVDIALIDSIGPNGATYKQVWFEVSAMGTIVLNGGSVKENEIYEYFELCNYNASNPNRDETITPVFFRVDPKKASEAARKDRTTKRQALNIAAEMGAADIRNFVAMMGWDENRDLIVLRDKVEEYAESHPDEFVRRSKNKQNAIYALISRAKSARVITFDASSNTWKWVDSQEQICTVARGTKRDDSLVAHLVESDNGSEVLKALKLSIK
tara:strand:- start:1829 stop:2650 length:822 start_codon:yes stop_codon:yes gene_type:complete